MLEDGTFLASELYSTLLPFSLDAISKYKGILYMMAILHVSKIMHHIVLLIFLVTHNILRFQEEIMKQISIMKNLDLIINHEGSMVRDVLKVPKALKDLLKRE